MVGDIAGILNLVMARDTDVEWSPEIRMSALVVDGEIRRRNVPLRGWQRADLNNGEEAMDGREKRNSVHSGRDGGPMVAPARPGFGDRGLISPTPVACF
jgi:hypothetical protein